MKTVVKVLLGASVVLLSYFCIMSIVTPIEFENIRKKREKVIITRLIDLRKAQLEFKDQNGRFTSSLDTLVLFVKEGKKKLVSKEGALTDLQLEAGLTERKAMEIIKKGDIKEIEKNGLQGFRRDTILVDVITDLYDGKYDASNVYNLAFVPFSDNVKFEMDVYNDYTNNLGIHMPLFEVRAPFNIYLYDLDHQEILNLTDRQSQLNKYTGLKVGSVTEPNNNAGNWE